MKLSIHILSIFLGVFVAVHDAAASVELASLGNPKCDPPGRWKTGRKLNFTESRAKGAVVSDNGVSWLTKLEDCANWCCRLPPGEGHRSQVFDRSMFQSFTPFSRTYADFLCNYQMIFS